MSAEALAHLRACPDCLEQAAADDPMNLFRAIGGDDVTPPGGVDAFVGGVMNEVRLREAERRVETPFRRKRFVPWSIAAALVLAFVSGIFLRPNPAVAPMAPTATVASAPVPAEPQPIVPVVEKYAAADATIVEVPTQPDDDIRVVMIFDENLPVDL